MTGSDLVFSLGTVPCPICFEPLYYRPFHRPDERVCEVHGEIPGLLFEELLELSPFDALLRLRAFQIASGASAAFRKLRGDIDARFRIFEAVRARRRVRERHPFEPNCWVVPGDLAR